MFICVCACVCSCEQNVCSEQLDSFNNHHKCRRRGRSSSFGCRRRSSLMPSSLPSVVTVAFQWRPITSLRHNEIINFWNTSNFVCVSARLSACLLACWLVSSVHSIIFNIFFRSHSLFLVVCGWIPCFLYAMSLVNLLACVCLCLCVCMLVYPRPLIPNTQTPFVWYFVRFFFYSLIEFSSWLRIVVIKLSK